MGRYEDTCFEACGTGLPWWATTLVIGVVYGALWYISKAERAGYGHWRDWHLLARDWIFGEQEY